MYTFFLQMIMILSVLFLLFLLIAVFFGVSRVSTTCSVPGSGLSDL